VREEQEEAAHDFRLAPLRNRTWCWCRDREIAVVFGVS
jgi:hypothetical protein